jgi:hypothetical protein
MHTFGSGVLLAGIFVAILAQFYAAVLAFKVSAVHGFLCFIIPGYLIVVARKYGFYGRTVGLWFCGVAGMGLGTILLS